MKYVIIPTDDVTIEMIDASTNSSLNNTRKSIDGSKTLLKWHGDTPSCFDGMTSYTNSEIKTELVKSEWTGE
jgi:hypothetical protein